MRRSGLLFSLLIACGCGEAPRPRPPGGTAPAGSALPEPPDTDAPAPAASAAADEEVPPSEVAPLFIGFRTVVARAEERFDSLDDGCGDMYEAMTPLWGDARRAMVLPRRQAERLVKADAKKIVAALKRRAYADVARYVHPAHGVCMRAAKGSACVTLSSGDFARCSGNRKADWPVDSGTGNPYTGTCHEAVRDIFMARDFTKADAQSFNCFQPMRGNNGAGIVRADNVATAYAEFVAKTIEPTDANPSAPYLPWRALRLGFVIEEGKPLLVELLSEYWGI